MTFTDDLVQQRLNMRLCVFSTKGICKTVFTMLSGEHLNSKLSHGTKGPTQFANGWHGLHAGILSILPFLNAFIARPSETSERLADWK